MGVTHFLFVNQNPEQLDRRDGRVCVIQLNLVFLSKLGPVSAMSGLVPSYDILDGCTAKEVLLLEPKFFAFER
jgi:hypothetical protein